MKRQSLVDYAFRLAHVKPSDVKFVIIDGSTGAGSERKYSDYDVVVVKKGKLKRPGSVEDLLGIYKGRLFSGWLADEDSFKHRYIGDDDQEFIWRRRQLRKARLLYGDREEFDRVIRKALARRWNWRRQVAVIRYSYVTMVEYVGKMLNKVESHEEGTPEFYQDGHVIAWNAALIIAALNKVDLDSENMMYRQIFAAAKVRPPNFERDFGISSGHSAAQRNPQAVVSASKRLIRWARRQIRSAGLIDSENSGFAQIVREFEV